MAEGRRSVFAALALETYRVEESAEAWASARTRQLQGVFPDSAGAAGRVLDMRTGTPRGGYVLHDCRPEIAVGLRQEEATSQNRIDLVLHGRGLRRFVSGPLPPALQGDPYVDGLLQGFHAADLDDMRHLSASAGDLCVTAGVMLPRGASIPGTPAAWLTLARHFEAGLALQQQASALSRALSARGEPADPASPEGRPRGLGAGGAAEALRRHLRARAARPSGGAPPAAEVWRGLVEGSWSLLDTHDHGGLRYLLAVRASPGVRDPRALLPREAQIAGLAAGGHFDKEIAYALGVGRSTVATQLHAALRKLALPSRVALVRAFEGRSPPSLEGAARVASPPTPRSLSAHDVGGAVLLVLDLGGREAPLERALGELPCAQREVALLAAEGLDDVSIARATGRSRHTVSNLLRAAYRRVGVASRVELTAALYGSSG